MSPQCKVKSALVEVFTLDVAVDCRLHLSPCLDWYSSSCSGHLRTWGCHHHTLFKRCLIRDQNICFSWSESLLPLSKFQVGCPCAFFTKEWPQSGFYYAGWLGDCCRNGFPLGRFSCLQRGTLELWQWLLGSWSLLWLRSFSSDGSVEMADQLWETFWWVLTFSTPRWWRRLCSMRPSMLCNIFCTLPQMRLRLKTLPSQRSTGDSLDFTLVSCTVNCGFLYRQVLAFLNHVNHLTELTTSGLLLSYRNV